MSADDLDWDGADRQLVADFTTLWDEADLLWETHQNRPEFGGYVSADYHSIYTKLRQLRGRVHSVLEWGSGLGVVTIMASRLGFDAYGIECEKELVDQSREYARRFAPEARFAFGNFIPDEFPWNPAQGDEVQHMVLHGGDAYAELDMELRDFDLVYAYPWPEEHIVYHNIMRACAGPHALFLSYDAREGLELTRFN